MIIRPVLLARVFVYRKEKIMPVTIRRATYEEMKAHENEVIIFASRHPNYMTKSSNPFKQSQKKNYIREATLQEIKAEEAKGMLVYVSHKKHSTGKSSNLFTQSPKKKDSSETPQAK